ncbi:hypothetical protein ACWC9T_27165 [Kitasatospora sp. NPDC001159]
MATTTAVNGSVRVEAVLDEPLSRWLRLVKWLLLVPHHLALAALRLVFLPCYWSAVPSMCSRRRSA